jgi:hypothetical protein
MHVTKQFRFHDDDGRLVESSFSGVVQAVDKDDDNSNVMWWLVVYEDGDEEHLELQEVLDILDFGEDIIKPRANKETKLPQPKKKKVSAAKVESGVLAEAEADNLFKHLPNLDEECLCPAGAAELICGIPNKEIYCVDIQKIIDVVPALNTQLLNLDLTTGPEADFTTLADDDKNHDVEKEEFAYISDSDSGDENPSVQDDPDLLFKYCDISIMQGDMNRLQTNDWLNDKLVDFGMIFELNRAEVKNVSLVSTFFFAYGNDAYYLRPNCLYGNPKKSTTSRHGLKPMSEVTLIPINQAHRHWTLIVLIKQLSFDKVKLIYLDSTGGMWHQPCAMIKDLCETKFGVNVEIIQGQLGKLQKNGFDCGVFLVKWTSLIAKFAD